MTPMTPMTPDERWDAVKIVMDEASPPFGSPDQAADWLAQVEHSARLLHRIYVRQCNGYSPRQYAYPERAEARDERDARRLETALRAMFEERALGLYLNADPRGNPVGIHTPRTGRYNTMGGAECGWRL